MKKMTPEELEQFIHRELRSLPTRKAPAGFEARLQAAVEARTAQSALSPERLEQLVSRELHALPLRRAPHTLESRVLAAIENQAVIAWYHKSWTYWPGAVRAAFLAVSSSAAASIIAVFYLMFNGAEASSLVAQAGERLSLLGRLYDLAGWVAEIGVKAIADIPSLWLYGGFALVVGSYVTFFGLGAAAYRALYRRA